MENSWKRPCQASSSSSPAHGEFSAHPHLTRPRKRSSALAGELHLQPGSTTDPNPLQGEGFSSHSLPGPLVAGSPASPAKQDPPTPTPPQGLPCSIPRTPNGAPEDPSFPPGAREMLEQEPSQAQGRAGCEETSWSSSHPPPSREGTCSPGSGIAGKVPSAGIPAVPASGTGTCLLVSLAAQVPALAAGPVPPGPPCLALGQCQPWVCLQGTRMGRDSVTGTP